MQFHDLNVLRSDACGFVNLRSCGSRHVVADDLHHVAVLESAWSIGGQGLCLDHYVSRQPVLAGELFAADDSIREQAKYYLEEGVPIDIKVVWHNRPFEAIIQEVVAGGHDLLLKMAHQHDKLESVIFTPTDWHLLRKCPCPVWMVKDQPWPEGGKAVVAVNLASEEDYHNSLNEKLVKETIQLADQVNHTEVHLVGAYPVTPINIAIELPEFDPSVYNDAIRGQHLLAMKALRQKFSIDENMTHVEKGLPEEVIPDLAEHLQAGIVVLGTIGRTGISAAFLGNTAEQVIDHLRCDLLVIKPDEFQTPIELDDPEDD